MNNLMAERYIEKALGKRGTFEERDLVKKRISLFIGYDVWEHIPFETLSDNVKIIDECILAIMSFRGQEE